MAEQLQIRIHHPDASPTLIYLPGLHGDWTLIGSFRRALGDRVRFVETTYPRTIEWSLDDHAAAVESALVANGITSGWLLGESFGSQVAWAMAKRNRFHANGIILAGGFARHPMQWAARLAERVMGGISLSLLVRLMFGYARIARFRYRRSPETLAGIQEFIERRSNELDRQAAKHRLHLVAENDPSQCIRQTALPVYGLSGLFDPIVPWFFVRRSLRGACPTLRDFHIVTRADHNVLSTAADQAAELILGWIRPK
jgi:pimeloyl-ACP methyl ester carboxylesterase